MIHYRTLTLYCTVSVQNGCLARTCPLHQEGSGAKKPSAYLIECEQDKVVDRGRPRGIPSVSGEEHKEHCLGLLLCKNPNEYR